jgi:hypothetical protein
MPTHPVQWRASPEKGALAVHRARFSNALGGSTAGGRRHPNGPRRAVAPRRTIPATIATLATIAVLDPSHIAPALTRFATHASMCLWWDNVIQELIDTGVLHALVIYTVVTVALWVRTD